MEQAAGSTCTWPDYQALGNMTSALPAPSCFKQAPGFSQSSSPSPPVNHLLGQLFWAVTAHLAWPLLLGQTCLPPFHSPEATTNGHSQHLHPIPTSTNKPMPGLLGCKSKPERICKVSCKDWCAQSHPYVRQGVVTQVFARQPTSLWFGHKVVVLALSTIWDHPSGEVS